MKILYADHQRDIPEAGFGSLPDSCLLRNNDHFYIPNFSSEIEAYACLILRVGKLGKCIAPQFVNRYYNGYTLGIDLRAATNPLYSDALRRGYDKSLSIGEFKPLPTDFDDGFSFSFNGTETIFQISDIHDTIDRCCSKLSEYYTFKIGDLVVILLGKLVDHVQIGDHLSAEIPGHKLHTQIK